MAKSQHAYTEPAIQQMAAPVDEIADRLRLPKNRFPFRRNMVVHGETKYISWDFSKAPFKTLELLQITDVQWGNVACKRARVIEYRDWVLEKQNRYVFFTGDNVDSATMQSKGTTWENTGTPQQQLWEFCDIFAPMRHRILGYVGGNHERRCLTTFGDLGITIAGLLQIPYSRGKQLIDITFGKHKGADRFKVSQWHGVGGAKTKGTVAQVLSRFAAEGDSSLYLMGHLHQPMIIPIWKERRGERGVKAVKAMAAIGSSFLDLWGSYAEVAGYGPGDVMMPRCVLDKNGGWELTLR